MRLIRDTGGKLSGSTGTGSGTAVTVSVLRGSRCVSGTGRRRGSEDSLHSTPVFLFPSQGDTNNVKLSLFWLPFTLNPSGFPAGAQLCFCEWTAFSKSVEVEGGAFSYLRLVGGSRSWSSGTQEARATCLTASRCLCYYQHASQTHPDSTLL